MTGTIATTVVAGGRDELISAQARAIDPGSSLAGLDLDLAAGSLRDVRGDGVAVSVQSARDWRWSLGERVSFTLGDGSPVSARVVAEYRRPLGFGEVLLPRPLVAGHVTRALDDAVFVAAGGARVAGELESLRASYPTLDVVTRNAYVGEVDAAGQKQALEVYVLLALIVVFCALGLVNALIQASARLWPTFISLVTRSQSAFNLLPTLIACITSSASMLWINMRFIVLSRIFSSSISLVTKQTERISRMSDELKLISLMRFRISPAVLGTSGRSIGFIWTITTSRLSQL